MNGYPHTLNNCICNNNLYIHEKKKKIIQNKETHAPLARALNKLMYKKKNQFINTLMAFQ